MADYVKAAKRAAARYGIDPQVFLNMIKQESGFNPNARSPAGAQGIAQFIPSTAKSYGVNLNDNRVTDDLQGAARYLRDNLQKTGGNYHQALSIYNSGRPEGYKSIPETANYVRSILSGTGGAQASPSSSSSPQTTTRTVPGVDNSAARRALILQFLQQRHNPQALVGLASGLQGAQDTPSRTVRTSSPGSPGRSATVNALTAEAQKISDAKVPYQWGGGHQARAASNSPVTPLDCSGAVSRVLGINPRVSGEFAKWGKAGDGGSSGVTVYSSPTHVLMKINGHFWGTSQTNPGGGAGWIPQSAIGADYLKNFTARHQ